LLQKVGFESAELVQETGFNSSPKTKGVLFHAVKPVRQANEQAPADDAKSMKSTNELGRNHLNAPGNRRFRPER
jgi:hypothetical protein